MNIMGIWKQEGKYGHTILLKYLHHVHKHERVSSTHIYLFNPVLELQSLVEGVHIDFIC